MVIVLQCASFQGVQMMKQLPHSNNSCSMISLSFVEMPYEAEDFVICCSVSRFSTKCTSNFANTVYDWEQKHVASWFHIPEQTIYGVPIVTLLTKFEEYHDYNDDYPTTAALHKTLSTWLWASKFIGLVISWFYKTGFMRLLLWHIMLNLYSHSRCSTCVFWVIECKSLLPSMCISLLSSLSSMYTLYVWKFFDANATCDFHKLHLHQLTQRLQIPCSGSSSPSFKILLCCSVEKLMTNSSKATMLQYMYYCSGKKFQMWFLKGNLRF